MIPAAAAIILAAMLVGCAVGPAVTTAPAPAPRWAIALHGGAGTISRDAGPEREAAYRDALAEALEAGRAVLAGGGTSLDAVETVVRQLEDNPLFNAGRGAAYAHHGGHELDACIMDGATLSSGAVAGVRNIRNPVTLARHVMEKTPHRLFVGAGAYEMAMAAGFEHTPDSWFETEMRRERWLRLKEQERISREAGEVERGTVGAVALDIHGNLAAATSTGGLTNKPSGRVGDSPLAGIGNYANNATCAVSCTGHGEEFIRHTAAFRVSALMEYSGRDLDGAVGTVLANHLPPGAGGIIAVDRNGAISLQFTTRGMYRAAANSDGLHLIDIWR
jgi:beta-aspartyl-peptidase (threonine type)